MFYSSSISTHTVTVTSVYLGILPDIWKTALVVLLFNIQIDSAYEVSIWSLFDI